MPNRTKITLVLRLSLRRYLQMRTVKKLEHNKTRMRGADSVARMRREYKYRIFSNLIRTRFTVAEG
jgi:hypothetical protein